MKKNRTIYRNGNSRSYNAECAEDDGRYPLTRAAKAMGISLKTFKEALIHICYTSAEWHHVSKYANKVDYYDTNEIGENPRFWLFVSKKSKKNRLEYRQKASKLQFALLLEKLTSVRRVDIGKKCFKNDIKRRCESFCIPYNALFDALPAHQQYTPGFEQQYVSNGSYMSDDYRIGYHGNVYSVGQSLTSRGKYITPFDLTIDNFRALFKKNNASKYMQWNKYQNEYRWIINREWINHGIANLKAGIGFNSHNSGQGMNDASHKAKRAIEACYKNRMESQFLMF